VFVLHVPQLFYYCYDTSYVRQLLLKKLMMMMMMNYFTEICSRAAN